MAGGHGGGGFHPFDVTQSHLVYTILGGFTVLFGLFSLAVKEKLYLGEAPIATVVGIIFGPYVLNLVDPYKWGGSESDTDVITLELTRVVIAIGVFAVGVELPKAYMKRHWRTMFFLLGPCMVWGWLISALLMWGMIPKLTYLSCLVIAACVTPTDPILAQAVVGGKFADKHVPSHIRHLLSAESGSNDGAAFPFLFIALYWTLDNSPGHAVVEWLYATWAYEVILGILIGACLGYAARKVMQFSERKKLIDRESFVAQYISLAVLSIGICTLLGSDDLLAAFACGCAFAWDGFFNKQTEESQFSNVIDLLVNCAAFIYIGAIIPFKDWGNVEFHLSVWRLIVLAILILLFRRMPVILALYKWIPDIKTFREAVFVGWFGPMGVGAVFIATLARSKIPDPANDGDTSQVDLLQETIHPIVFMLVLASILTHGLSIPFLLTGRRVHSITYTWSRNPSMDVGRGDEPAWTTHTNRLHPGQQVNINRDDEDSDIGLSNLHSKLEQEKAAREGSEGSDGSGGSASTRAQQEGEDGKNTQRITEYREGQHLIVENRDPSGEVDVQVVRNVFPHGQHDDSHSHISSPTDGDPGTPGMPVLTVTRSRPSVSEGTAPTPVSTGTNRASSDDDDHSTNAGSDDEDAGDGFVRRRPYQHTRQDSPEPESRTSTGQVHSYISADRVRKPEKPEGAGWRRFLRVGTGSSNASNAASLAEEGRAGEDGFRRTPTGRSLGVTRTQTHDPHDRGLAMTRTVSFAPDAAPSSDTAPGIANYGSAAPGFKRNPTLSMSRTTSIRSQDDGLSVSFAEPRRGE